MASGRWETKPSSPCRNAGLKSSTPTLRRWPSGAARRKVFIRSCGAAKFPPSCSTRSASSATNTARRRRDRENERPCGRAQWFRSREWRRLERARTVGSGGGPDADGAAADHRNGFPAVEARGHPRLDRDRAASDAMDRLHRGGPGGSQRPAPGAFGPHFSFRAMGRGGAQAAMPAGFLAVALGIVWHAAPDRRGRLVAALGLSVPCVFGFLPAPHSAAMLAAGVGVILAAALLGLPIFATLGGIALMLFWNAGVPVAAVPVETYRLVASPVLPSIPLFTFA